MTRVDGPSRIHFGLIHVPTRDTDRWPGLDDSPGLPVRRFGGVGLMVDRPGVAVEVERASDWSATGVCAERALQFAQSVAGPNGGPFRVTVRHCPQEHIGLGVGTQLAMAVAKAVDREQGGSAGAVELANRVGRGRRSAVGVHGSHLGGLIVEAGKLDDDSLSPVVVHVPFPPDWRIVLITPPGSPQWSGGRERAAFAELSEHAADPRELDCLARLILLGMLPAIHVRDLDGFGDAVYEFNARVGDRFAAVQGGRYVSLETERLVKALRECRIRGVGQTSWGPTVFTVVSEAQAGELAERFPGSIVACGWNG